MLLRPSLLVLALMGSMHGHARADTSMPRLRNGEAGEGNVVTLASGLRYVDLRVGSGAKLGARATITVHYVGRLSNGTEIDSTRRRGEPAMFQLGRGQLIQGWELGVPGMRIGGVRRLIIPPSLAYGDRTTGAIPPGSTLTFDVELLGFD
jgi:peptidylprolyl isomerase